MYELNCGMTGEHLEVQSSRRSLSTTPLHVTNCQLLSFLGVLQEMDHGRQLQQKQDFLLMTCKIYICYLYNNNVLHAMIHKYYRWYR